ncbi:LCP family protein [Curtobacterium sp. Leaf261]|uniref:LCP family protein n=1 Tax=Curtobacterium sp. Leaf261 TaxID=1736311 RepID=UPI0012E12866|nr:LCP family protein [Curtobacterium sp. Leaf261]
MSEFDDLTDPRRQPTIFAGPGHRVSGGRHGRRRPDLGMHRLLAGIGITAAVAIASAGSLTAYAAYDVGHGLAENSVDVGGAADSIDGAFNVLAVAADNDPAQGDAYGVRGATLNDSNVLLHVSADHTQAVAVSFPRDLIVDQPACSARGTMSPAVTNTPLNQAYGRGGLACVVSTIEHVSGLSIPFAAQMSFSGIIGLSDAIGGVPVCVTDRVDDPFTGLKLKAGNHTVSGATALAFLRDRHGVGDGSDLSRISSLQQFLSSLVRKVKSDGTLEDPTKLYRLARVASKSVVLSTSLAKPDTLVGIARTFQGIGLDRITFVQYPGTTTDPSYPGKVVPIAATADQLMRAVAHDRPIGLDSDAIGRGSTTATDTATGDTATGGTDQGGTDEAGGDAGGGGSAASTRGDSGSTDGGADDAGRASSASPETIPGVTGQTAEQKTCAVAAAG